MFVMKTKKSYWNFFIYSFLHLKWTMNGMSSILLNKADQKSIIQFTISVLNKEESSRFLAPVIHMVVLIERNASKFHCS